MSALLPVYERDLVIVSGKGTRVFDASGRGYLDFAAGIGVNGLGHRDRRVLAAIRRQSARIIHTSNLYHTEVQQALAERLVAISFPAKVFFCNSGTEATEAAIKFARRVGRPSGRTEILAFEGSFHGRTLGALSLTWRAKYREPFEPLLPGARFLPWNDLDAAARSIGPETAAVFVEPVQGEGGVRLAPPDFLRGLSQICRRAGALLVTDEVQCGLGRTGKMFAFQHAEIIPDILTLAKPLGGGLPLGAVLLHHDLAPALSVGDHGSTFGGNPVACAAALAVLERLTSSGFLRRVQRRGTLLRRGLERLAGRPATPIAEIRGVGLMVGVELRCPAALVLQGLRARGVLATKAGDHVLRLLPPLTVTPAEVGEMVTALDTVLAECGETGRAEKGNSAR